MTLGIDKKGLRNSSGLFLLEKYSKLGKCYITTIRKYKRESFVNGTTVRSKKKTVDWELFTVLQRFLFNVKPVLS